MDFAFVCCNTNFTDDWVVGGGLCPLPANVIVIHWPRRRRLR